MNIERHWWRPQRRHKHVNELDTCTLALAIINLTHFYCWWRVRSPCLRCYATVNFHIQSPCTIVMALNPGTKRSIPICLSTNVTGTFWVFLQTSPRVSRFVLLYNSSAISQKPSWGVRSSRSYFFQCEFEWCSALGSYSDFHWKISSPTYWRKF